MKTLVLLAVFGFLSNSGRVVNFDNSALGHIPEGWSVPDIYNGAPPKWEIRRDQSAPTQPYVLAQVSGSSENRSPLVLFDELSFRNGDVSVRLKPLSGSQYQAGGVVFRYRDENNYYVARADAAGQHVSLLKVENGRRTQIGHAVKRELPANDWSILKVALRGNRMQIYVDHRRMLRAEDNTFNGAGKAGLWTPAEAVTYFDDFRVDPD